MADTRPLPLLNERSTQVFRQIVDSYLEGGEPVGSRTLAQRLPGLNLSPASIRNVMSDLEHAGLLFSPHTSAGRMPTQAGLRMFVDGLLEVGDLTEDERTSIEARLAGQPQSLEDMLTQATEALSGLSHCAGLVMAPKSEAPLKHVEFVQVSPGKGLVILVAEDGAVENRVIDLPQGLPMSALVEATNFINAHLGGQTLAEAGETILQEIQANKTQLDQLATKIVQAGLATWAGGEGAELKSLIVRGQSQLLNDLSAQEDLERVRRLFDDLETKRDLAKLLDLAKGGDSVRVFIGSETQLFSLSGSSVIVAPYMNGAQKIVGVIGIIGPQRLNYARIIPMVDYTAQVVGRLLS
jgi:heat-inducible transcriptional repressor